MTTAQFYERLDVECAAEGCDRRRKGSHLMCGRCWSRVPEPVKRDVYWYWRKFRRDPDRENRQRYGDAVRAAIDAVGTVSAS